MLSTFSFARARHGRIHVFFNGRIFAGPDWRILIASVLLIAGGSALFVCYTNEVLAARVVVALFAVASIVSLVICGLSDPGIKPREPPPPPDATPHESLWRERTYVDADGVVHRRRMEAKWCYSCHTYRPYRGVHCRFCDACVTRRDHHCPWVGTCIGARNYRSYVALVWCLSVLLLTAFIGGIQSLAQRSFRHGREHSDLPDGPSGFTSALIDTYCVELLLILISFVFGVLTVSLAIHHTYLMTQNLTSGDVAKDLPENLYTYGSVLANMWVVLSGCKEEVRDLMHTEVVIEADDSAVEDEPCPSPVQSPSVHGAVYDNMATCGREDAVEV